MQNVNRRRFLQNTTAATASLVWLGARAGAASANDRIVVGFMGLGGRGGQLLEKFAARPDVEVAWLCDPDLRRVTRAQKLLESKKLPSPKTSQDFRRILENKSVQVLVNATPDHWHGPGTIYACQAGKDVYVEKPFSHNAREGRLMINAARKYQRVVQLGTQTRSAPYAKAAAEFLQSGKMGDIKLVRVFNMMQHSPAQPAAEQAPPPELDYELWCGPAAKPPYNPGRRWLDQSEYSCGAIPGDAVHQLDLARLVLGDPPAPKKVSHTGGIQVLKDGRDLPDTQLATFEFDNFTLMFEAALWMPYMHKIAIPIRDGDLFPEWQFCATRIEILGTRNFMYLGRHGGGWQVFDGDHKIIAQQYGRQADAEHIGNFLDSVRSRKQPAANPEQGHLSTLLCHLANAAWRAGNRTLAFDGRTETFPDYPAANAFLRRANYREPWKLGDEV